MIAFDTDVLSDLFADDPVCLQRAVLIPPADQVIPVVAFEEVLRGRLDAIRRAQSGRIRLTIERAYELFQESLERAENYRLLPYTSGAEALFQQWRRSKVRVGSQDLRIAAICLDHGATLATRNARDYAQIPGFMFDEWN